MPILKHLYNLHMIELQDKDMQIQKLNELLNEKDNEISEFTQKAEDFKFDVEDYMNKIEYLEQKLDRKRNKINELNSIIDHMKQQKVQTKFIMRKPARSDVEENNIKLKMVEEIYNLTKNENLEFDEDFVYGIDMDNQDDDRILEYTSQIKFPKIHGLWISKLPSIIDSRLEKLLKHSFIHPLSQLEIGWFSSSQMSDYINALSCILSRTIKFVRFDYPRLDYAEFSQI